MNPYQYFALILWCAFYLAYIAKMVLLARKGIKGSILGKNVLEKVLLTVTYGGAAVQFISLMFPQWIWSFPALTAMRTVGLIFMFCAVVIFIVAMTTMQTNWRAGFNEKQDTSLVTHGIYSISRNPAFVGFDLLYVGCALVFPNAMNIAIALAALVVFHLQILSEEKFLVQTFKEEYTTYRRAVMRYIGRNKQKA